MSTTEPLVPVRQLAKDLFGVSPSLPTLWRWCKQGYVVNGRFIRLACVKGMRGCWLSTVTDFRRFAEERTGCEPLPD
jgi:hypothetical protein